MEREYAELAERRIGAAERGSRWEIQTIGAVGTRKMTGGASA